MPVSCSGKRQKLEKWIILGKVFSGINLDYLFCLVIHIYFLKNIFNGIKYSSKCQRKTMRIAKPALIQKKENPSHKRRAEIQSTALRQCAPWQRIIVISLICPAVTGLWSIASPPIAVQITGNWPITLSPALLQQWSSLSPRRSRWRDPSHLVWVAQVCLPWRDCSPLLLKGRPAERAVHHPDLPVCHNSSIGLRRPNGVQWSTLRAF